jgi:DNA ligase-1
MTFKPLLAASTTPEDLLNLEFPLIWSPKLDGIRTLIHETGPVSRKIKLLPNDKLRAFLGFFPLKGMDGEMLFGPVTDKDVFNRTQSAVMKIAGPDPRDAAGKYLVFDDFTSPDDPFSDRFARLTERVSKLDEDAQHVVQLVPHETVDNLDDLNNVERIAVEQGYEGIMIRCPKGRYKFGRSTLRERILCKIKRFADFDGQIVEAYEMMHNDNEKVADALGHGKRSSHQENMRPAGMVGGFTVTSPEFPGLTFNVGPGVLTHDQRKTLWEQRETLPGRWLVGKYQPSGMKDAPRFSGFKAFRKD